MGLQYLYKLGRKSNETQNNVRKKLSSNADFGKYMILRRFKELRSIISKIMEDLTLKEQRGDWYQFKSRAQMFNNNRKHHSYASHILVFDGSMSAYIPR